MPSILAVVLTVAAIGLVFVYMCKTDKNTHNSKSMRSASDGRVYVVAAPAELPIFCVGTLGGDIMQCPCNGVCPLNGQRCQPADNCSWCCTD